MIGLGDKTPRRYIRPGSCPRAASGHATAPPKTPKNSRRLMSAPASEDRIVAAYMCDELRGVSFDHLVGEPEQRWRHREAEHPGGLEIENEIELGWLLHG